MDAGSLYARPLGAPIKRDVNWFGTRPTAVHAVGERGERADGRKALIRESPARHVSDRVGNAEADSGGGRVAATLGDGALGG